MRTARENGQELGNPATAGMRRLRAGAYVSGNYLVRYHAWLNEAWDGSRDKYRPWHIFRRSSPLDNRVLLERTATLEEAVDYVKTQRRLDGGVGTPGIPD